MTTEHWLPIAAGVFLIGMMLYGHYRGFIRQCVSVGALVLTLIIVKLATPWMTEFIRDNPSIRANAAQMILGAAGWEAPLEEEIQLPSAQRISLSLIHI